MISLDLCYQICNLSYINISPFTEPHNILLTLSGRNERVNLQQMLDLVGVRLKLSGCIKLFLNPAVSIEMGQ